MKKKSKIKRINKIHIKNILRVAVVFVFIFVIVLIYGALKPLPEGVSVEGEIHQVLSKNISFFSDRTYWNNSLEIRQSEQEIFDEMFTVIKNAKEHVVVDMFLFNDFVGKADVYRSLSDELTQVLVEKKVGNPYMPVVFITDPINEVYGGVESKHLRSLRDAGVNVVITDLTKLRDSNFMYSPFWKIFIQWFGTSVDAQWLPNPFESGGEGIGLRSYFKAFNFKANHRKVVVADDSVLVTSANPHDGSSAHSNVAIRIDDANFAREVLQSEQAVINFSLSENERFSIVEGIQSEQLLVGDNTISSGDTAKAGDDEVSVQLLTEKKIKKSIIASVDNLQEGDSLDMVIFYIADRGIVKSLKRASERGVTMRLLFDANKDAFGREKNGKPNRQVASELVRASDGNISVRWCDTHGEQCHSKLLLLESDAGYEMFIGSANFTRRNIGDYNLETNIKLSDGEVFGAFDEAREFFELQWEVVNVEDGITDPSKSYSLEYEEYKDDSRFKYWSYRFKEWSGLSPW